MIGPKIHRLEKGKPMYQRTYIGENVKDIQALIKTYRNGISMDNNYSALTDEGIQSVLYALDEIDSMINDYLYGHQ